MIKINRVLVILVSIFLSLFLIGCAGSTDQPDDIEQVNAESDLPEQSGTQAENDSENQGSDQAQPDGAGTKPYPGSGFKHDVEMKIEGIIEYDQGEEWWLID